MLPLIRAVAKRLAQSLNLGAAEPPYAGLRCQLANSLGGVGFDLPETHAMLKDRVQGRHGPRRDAFPACCGPTTAADARFRSLAGGDVGLRALNVAELE